MKKKTITIGALLLAMTSFSQTDTLAYSVNGKRMLEFDYYTSEIENIIKPKEYQDFTIKLKKNKFLFLDLFDHISRDTLYLLYRDVTIYDSYGQVDKHYINSNNKTFEINGSLVKKVIVHKPELKEWERG